MRILAIETSCDETAISIIEARGTKHTPNFTVLSNIVSSQIAVHKKFGGVVPNIALREHQKNLVPILLTALKEAQLYKSRTFLQNIDHAERINQVYPFIPVARPRGIPGKVRAKQKSHTFSNTLIHRCIKVLDREPELAKLFLKIFGLTKPRLNAIAVTQGPGLEPALWVGINFAKALSMLWNVPIVPVNHMEGHIFSALLEKNRKGLKKISFPALALLVSGGHTELVLIKKWGSYKIIGETLDDAVGEAFDKVARMLSLGYPGGPAISKRAEGGDSKAILFPRPMITAKNFDFSFSGLKTAILYYLRDHKKINISDVAASFQQATIDVLVSKTIRALKEYKAKTLILGGGVSANKLLRQTLTDIIPEKTNFFAPDFSMTGDNALMIGLAAFFKKSSKKAQFIRARGNLKISE